LEIGNEFTLAPLAANDLLGCVCSVTEQLFVVTQRPLGKEQNPYSCATRAQLLLFV
jgi:hypothetical protein